MLRLVFGESGSGKTQWIYDWIGQQLEQSDQRRILLIVPEQHSFSTERELHRRFPGCAEQVEVLSFARLSHAIFRQYGGLAKQQISDAGRCILMSLALEQLRDRLAIYRKQYHRPEFVQQMVDVVKELKHAAVSPQLFEELAEQAPRNTREKLQELSLMYSVYQGIAEQQFTDEYDDLLRAAALAEENRFFSDYMICLDAFKGFTAGELQLIRCMMQDAVEVSAALCCDGLQQPSGGTDPFVTARETAQLLIRLARETGRDIKTPVVLKELHRFASPELEWAVPQFLHRGALTLDEVPQDQDRVVFVAAADPEEEIELMAVQMLHLVRDCGYRWREIVAVTRDLVPYEESIRSCFAKYEIPVFYDRQKEILRKPLVKALLAFLQAACYPEDTDAIFAFLKSTFSPIPFEQVCLLENYCLVWGIGFGRWDQPFTQHPDGFSAKWDELSQGRLQEINEMREFVYNGIAALREQCAACDGIGFAKAIYAALEYFSIPQRLHNWGALMESDGDIEQIREMDAIWGAVMDCLDQMALSLNGVSYDIRRMKGLFELSVAQMKVAFVPQHLDEVLVGAADRVRYDRPRAVFVFGANEGSFPARMQQHRLLTDVERDYLRGKEVKIGGELRQQFADERFFAYAAISAPQERLYVSYTQRDAAGHTGSPSVILHQLRALLPQSRTLERDNFTEFDFLRTEQEVRERCADSYSELYCDLPNGLWDAAQRYFAETGRDSSVFDRIQWAAKSRDYSIHDSDLSAELFGKKLRLSASQVEAYHRCRFAYFCRRWLNVKPLQKAQLTPAESGTYLHYCLYKLLAERSKEAVCEMDSAALALLAEQITDQYTNELLMLDPTENPRIWVLIGRLKDTAHRLFLRIRDELAQSEFLPVAVEQPIRRGEDVEPLVIPLSNGGTLQVEGFVDRIDCYEHNGVKYLRVVDYKSGDKKFKRDDVMFGLNIQMLLYLFTLCEQKEGPYAGAVPAGILYLPIGDNYHNADPEDQSSDAGVYRMNGLLLEDADIIRAMEREGQGLFIPAKFKKDGGFDRYSSLAALEDFGALRQQIEEVLVEMAENLKQGVIFAEPSFVLGQRICEYCEYRRVCLRPLKSAD